MGENEKSRKRKRMQLHNRITSSGLYFVLMATRAKSKNAKTLENKRKIKTKLEGGREVI